MSTNAAFAATPRFEVIEISTANTARDGTGTITTLFTAGPNGSRVDSLAVSAQGTTTAGWIRGFIRASEEDPWVFWWEVPVPAVTPAAGSTAVWMAAYQNLAWVLTADAQIGFSTHIAETFTVYTVTAGDF